MTKRKSVHLPSVVWVDEAPHRGTRDAIRGVDELGDDVLLRDTFAVRVKLIFETSAYTPLHQGVVEDNACPDTNRVSSTDEE